jgi:acetyl-CoA/propionyl-CoA carboxylase biotin carboxyl carrier protein
LSFAQAQEVSRIVKILGRALGVVGLLNVQLAVTGDGEETIWIARDGHQLEARAASADRSRDARPGSLEAPMPGTVLQVRVANGDTVAEGDVLLVLESMKMELSIIAPRAGTVAGLELSAGDRVARHEALVEVSG